ncbi:zinc finger protein 709-like isoform X2 [Xyrichtys novacula]|uniref:Zinc finger protein 709-like isoform X2 n=1 Tax=Xyrichtys novacula TaxID=13765 RepID=A0AAV1H2C6_XYRNO|nr:zinc finger protein 709-like isoform X2 [Xyrichtys novacula]
MAEKTPSTEVETNCFQVKKEENDSDEEMDVKPFYGSHPEGRTMSIKVERDDGESEEDWGESEGTGSDDSTDDTDDTDDDEDMETNDGAAAQTHKSNGAQAAPNKGLYQQKYSCKVCGRSFCFKALLINHVKNEEKDSDLCGVCGKRFESKESLTLHLQIYVSTNDCEVCLRRFDTPKILEMHMMRHTGEKPHVCSVCGGAFNQKAALKRHMSSHRKEKLYVCSACGQSFKPTLSSEQNPKLCGVCSEHLDSDESFRMHLEVNYKENTSRDQTEDSQTLSSNAESKDWGKGGSDDGENMNLMYCCKVCGRSFGQRAWFWKHVTENEKGTDICGVCGKRFESEESLRLHLQTYIPTKACKVCGKRFDCLYRLDIHMRTHTGEKPYVCSCGKAFAIKGGLKRHMQIHTRTKLYVCIMCGQSFRQTQGFKQRPLLCGACGKDAESGERSEVHTVKEENTHTDAESKACDSDEEGMESEPSEGEAQGSDKPHLKYSCKVCGRSFCHRAWFLKHVTETEKDKDICGVCGKHFESEESLRLHLQTYVPTKDCKVCGKQLSHPALLETHMRTHTGEKPYVCSVCGKAFSGNRNLMKHMQTHTEEKPYDCRVCGQSFRYKEYLGIHMRTHTGERPFPCSVCEKRFGHRGALKTHMRLHTGEFRHHCLVCGKKFNMSSALKIHMRSHTGERPFVCDVCGKSFKARSVLKTHTETHKGGITTAATSVAKSEETQ